MWPLYLNVLSRPAMNGFELNFDALAYESSGCKMPCRTQSAKSSAAT
jgi:hypothetical protein